MTEQAGWFKKILGSGEAEELKEQVQALLAEVESRGSQLAEQGLRMAALEQQAQMDQTRSASLAETLETLSQRLHQAGQDRTALKAELKDAERSVDELQRRLKAETQRAASAVKSLSNAEVRVKTLASSNRKKEDEATSFKQEQKACLAKLEEARGELERLRLDGKASASQVEELKTQSKALDAAKCLLEAEKEAALVQSQERMANLEGEVAAAQAEASRLKRLAEEAMNAAQAQAQAARERLASNTQDAQGLLDLALLAFWGAVGPALGLGLLAVEAERTSWLAGRLSGCRGPLELAEGLNEIFGELGLGGVELGSEQPLLFRFQAPSSRDRETAEMYAHWVGALAKRVISQFWETATQVRVKAADEGFVVELKPMLARTSS